MSTIAVTVTTINDVRTHPNADALDIAVVKGWQVVVRRGTYQAGQSVVYFEPGVVLPREVADRFGVTRYMSEKTDIDGNRVLVLRQARLRGEASFGLAVEPDDPTWPVGTDVADHYGATKYRPPVRVSAGDSAPDHPRFPRYTDVENMRNYPTILVDGELVEATEKLHGTNVRVGRVGGELMAGSRTLRRAEPAEYRANTYWFPHTLASVQQLLADHDEIVLYGEVFGSKIQNYGYGVNGMDFRAFDLMERGQYVDRARFHELMAQYGIVTVPVIYTGPFSLEQIRTLADGPSVIGGTHGREGVVVRPLVERNDPSIGRVILKYIGDVYLFGQQQDTTDQ